MNNRALRRSFRSSLAKVIGVGLGAGAGTLLHSMMGSGMHSWGAAVIMALTSFGLMMFAEYEREME